MERFVALLFSGVTDGVVAALAAVGLLVLNKATGIVNFAHGDLITLGAYLGVWLINGHGWAYIPAVAVAVVLMFGVGVVMERVSLAPLRGKSVHVVVIATLGLALGIRSLIGIWQGTDPKRLDGPFTGRSTIFGAVITHHRLLVIAAAVVVLAAVMLFFARTSWGRQVRAVAADRQMAQLAGVRASGLSMAAFGFSAALAGLCGLLVAPLGAIDVNLGFGIMLNSFAAMVIGGSSSVGGVILAGIAIGLIERVLGGYFLTDYSEAFPFVFMILAIAIRPQGLFGQREHATRL